MMKNESERLPIGAGGEKLRALAETLPAIEVENEVVWVNPAFPELPFDIKEGKSTKLGLFLTPIFDAEGAKRVETGRYHGRSAILGRVIFRDKEGRFYRDVDIKGVGHSERVMGLTASQMEVMPVRPKYDPDYRDLIAAYGIFDLGDTRKSSALEEMFLDMGIRTSRTIAIVELREFIEENGRHIPVDRAKENGLIPPNFSPALAIRTFGTKNRIIDANTKGDAKENPGFAYADDARKLVAEEFGFKEDDFDFKKYTEWFAKTLAENVARMHRNDFVHNYLSNHNVTLDCRIVDLDSVERMSPNAAEKDKKIQRDLNGARATIRDLWAVVVNIIEQPISYYEIQKRFDTLKDIFNRVYKEEMAKKNE